MYYSNFGTSPSCTGSQFPYAFSNLKFRDITLAGFERYFVLNTFCLYLLLQELPSTPLASKMLLTHREIKLQTFHRENSLVHKKVWLKLLP